jgi:hypothetical protein
MFDKLQFVGCLKQRQTEVYRTSVASLQPLSASPPFYLHNHLHEVLHRVLQMILHGFCIGVCFISANGFCNSHPLSPTPLRPHFTLSFAPPADISACLAPGKRLPLLC